MKKYFIFFFFFTIVSCKTQRVCLNPSGATVDWYSIFFMPENNKKEIYYYYIDSTLPEPKLIKYEESTFPPTHVTKYALDKQDQSFNYIFWNDDKGIDESDAKSTTVAHAKGSLVYDSQYGAFILHSLPRYPQRTRSNDILTKLPDNSGVYAQTFLCISVNKENAEKIVEMLNCVHAQVNKGVDKDRVNSRPNEYFQGLLERKIHQNCKNTHNGKIYSKAGKPFRFFGKNYKSQLIPYDTTLGFEYNDNFFVRTWTRPSLCPSIHGKYNIINVLTVGFGSYTINSSGEHSKWAVAETKNIVCFSDLNHTTSQIKRGGHIVCFENKVLHDFMLKSIKETDDKTLPKKSLMKPFLRFK